MADEITADDIYSRLMVVSQAALENAYYETAYHSLCAALHCAQQLGDEQGLRTVEQEAQRQIDWINTHNPKHRMSSLSATEHHGVNLYNALARQAATQILIIQQNRRRENSRQFSWPDS